MTEEQVLTYWKLDKQGRVRHFGPYVMRTEEYARLCADLVACREDRKPIHGAYQIVNRDGGDQWIEIILEDWPGLPPTLPLPPPP